MTKTDPFSPSDTSAIDVAFVRFSAPDLDKLDRFLTDFGLVRRDLGGDSRLYRAAGDAPFVYAARLGEPRFDGFAFSLRDLEALEAFSARWELSSQPLEGSPGGRGVSLVDPDGFLVEAVFAGEKLEPAPLRPSLPSNKVDHAPRLGQERRLALRTACVCRLGHVVLQVTDLSRSLDWYQKRFGLLVSDAIVRDDTGEHYAAFLRLDRGETHTDHHSLFLLEGEAPAFRHVAFEVRDIDDLMVGHSQLQSGGYVHHRGIGRHLLGGQVFDYWQDPWGHVLEHWTDGDLFDASFGPRVSTQTELNADTWRSAAPLQP